MNQQSTQHDFIPPAEQASSFLTQEDEAVQYETVWENPTDKDVRFELYTGNIARGARPRTYEQKTGHRKILIPAKDPKNPNPNHNKARLSKEYDAAIQKVVDGGNGEKVCIGGLAPQLINCGLSPAERPKLDPSIDVYQAEVKAANERARKLALDAQAMREAAQVAQGKLEEAEQTKAVRDEQLAARDRELADREASLAARERALAEREKAAAPADPKKR
jgi:hypothetical protein